MIQGPAADWLAANRDKLNERMLTTIKRYPQFSVPNFFAELDAILPALATHAAVLDTAYDLVLLHVSRTTFTRMPALRRLFTEWLPVHLALAAAEPQLLAQLSNAIESSWAEGFVDALLLLPELDAPTLLKTGAVLAWRLGDARVRTAAQQLFSQLPARALLVALGHEDWDDAHAPLLARQLEVDQWRVWLDEPVTEVRVPALAYDKLESLACIGDFTGFGGVFDTPPRLMFGDDPHLFFVRCADQGFAITADGYGSRIRPLSEVTPEISSATPPSRMLAGYNWQTQGHVVICASRDSHRLMVFG